ncbi:MAG: hypothetical protein ACLUQ6_04290 [Alistipes onderdonkii]
MKTSVKGFMFYVAFVASLGGLLFGFDTAVISGAEKAIQGSMRSRTSRTASRSPRRLSAPSSAPWSAAAQPNATGACAR